MVPPHLNPRPPPGLGCLLAGSTEGERLHPIRSASSPDQPRATVDGLLTSRAASSGSILGVGGEAAGRTVSGTVDALADWVAGGLAKEAAARLQGNGDGGGARPAGDGGAVGSQGRDGIGGEECDSGVGMGMGSSSGSHARWVGGGDCGVCATCARTGDGYRRGAKR